MPPPDLDRGGAPSRQFWFGLTGHRRITRESEISERGATVDHFQQVADSKNLSQLIRSNTVHYWTAMKHQIDLAGLKPYLGHAGMLAGDPHAGNFAALPLRTPDGPRKMRYVNVDFDDCGRGPFVLDFIRFVIASKANHKEVKRRELEKAYHKGLAGKEMDPPKKVRDLLAMPVADYDAMAAEYLGSLCILFGIATRAIAALMVVFVAFTAVLGHPFWAADPDHYQSQYTNFMKNVAIMGGYLALFVAGSGSISVDGWLRRRG